MSEKYVVGKILIIWTGEITIRLIKRKYVTGRSYFSRQFNILQSVYWFDIIELQFAQKHVDTVLTEYTHTHTAHHHSGRGATKLLNTENHPCLLFKREISLLWRRHFLKTRIYGLRNTHTVWVTWQGLASPINTCTHLLALKTRAIRLSSAVSL